MAAPRRDFAYPVRADPAELESLDAILGPCADVPGAFVLRWLADEQVAGAIRRRCPEGSFPVLVRHNLVRLRPLERGAAYALSGSLEDIAHRAGTGLRMEFLLAAPEGEVLRGEVDMVFVEHAALG